MKNKPIIFKKLFIIFLVLLFSLADESKAQTNNQSAASKLDLCQKLQLFPENQVGNIVYKDKTWLFSNDEKIVYDAVHIALLGLDLLWVEDSLKNSQEFVFLPDSKKDLWQLLNKKLLKASLEDKNLILFIKDNRINCFKFPFNSISAELVDDNKSQVSFFHLAKIEKDAFNQAPVYQIKLHVYDYVNQKFMTLPYVLYSRSYDIKLSWLDDQIVVNFGNGEISKYTVNR